MLSKEFYNYWKRKIDIIQRNMVEIREDFSNKKAIKARQTIICEECKDIIKWDKRLYSDNRYAKDIEQLEECIRLTKMYGTDGINDGRYFRDNFPGGYYNIAEEAGYYYPDEL